MPPLALGPLEVAVDAILLGLSEKLHRQPGILVVEVCRRRQCPIFVQEIDAIWLLTLQMPKENFSRNGRLRLPGTSRDRIVRAIHVLEAREAALEYLELLRRRSFCCRGAHDYDDLLVDHGFVGISGGVAVEISGVV